MRTIAIFQTEKQMRFRTILTLGTLFAGALTLNPGAAYADVVRYPIPTRRSRSPRLCRSRATPRLIMLAARCLRSSARRPSPAALRPMVTPRLQTIGVLGKIKGILEGLGLGMGDVVKMQVFLVHDARAPMDFKAFMEGYTQFFGGNQPNLPARSVVGVAALANPGFLVEIEVIAARDTK